MKSRWLGGIALAVSLPVFGQSLEELKRRLAEKEAENRQLRQRIEVLEREVTPRRVKQARTSPAVAEDDAADSNRALERALVREGSLLLSPGVYEVEPNFVYSYSDSDSAAFRRDSFGPALAFRAGLPWRSQFEINVPYVVERRRSGAVETHSQGRGDLTLGISHQFLTERASSPGLIGALSYQASTGKNTLFESVTPVARGSGFDSLQGTLTAVKRIDPLVFFGSYSFTHHFSETKNGINVDPGNTHGLRFGTALATGPDTSLRAAFNVNFFDKTRLGDVALAGTDDTSALFEFGGSAVLTESTALDVLVGAGLTRSAPDFRITVALPIRF